MSTSSDTYIYDLTAQPEGSPHIFVKKDYLSLIDQNSQNYSSNVCTIATDVLSNSSKWISMYEAKLLIPLTITLTAASTANTFKPIFTPAVTGGAAASGAYCDYAIGLKNSILTIIHSLSTQYNGTTVTQQIPYCSLFNCFKLMTQMNVTDYESFASIGFAPDTLTSVKYSATITPGGVGTMNNVNFIQPLTISGTSQAGTASQGNIGFFQRQLYFGFNPQSASSANSLFTSAQCGTVYKSYISPPINPTATQCGVWQQFLVAEVRLRDLHDLFASLPLLKGSFLRMQLGLNNTSFTFSTQPGATTPGVATTMWVTALSSGLGGVNPLMLASTAPNCGGAALVYGAAAADPTSYIASIFVGSQCLNSSQLSFGGNSVVTNPLLKSVTLVCPAYTFTYDMEKMYIAQESKKVVYSELFNYTIYNVAPNQSFNQIVTSGIQGVQSILIMPLVSGSVNNLSGANGTLNLPPFQSPFDTCGAFSTAPCGHLTNVQCVVAGANILMKNEQYIYEAFGQQYLNEANQMNGNLSDGMSSGFIDELGFFYSPFYYINLSRGMASDDLVLKSIQVQGQNVSGLNLDIYVFLTYQKDFTINLLTGTVV